MFQPIKRTDSLQGAEDAFISFRPEHIAFNRTFQNIAGISKPMRVKFFVDDNNYKIGFTFSKNEESDSYALSFHNNVNCWCSIGELRNFAWVKAVSSIADKKLRRFKPKMESTEIGKLWTVQIYPAFENKRARESKDLPEGNGIYRYKRGGEVVYIGRGDIRKRLQEPQRKEWDFDLIEYSMIQNPDDQVKWEDFWIERHKEENGKLPIYNRVSGVKLTET